MTKIDLQLKFQNEPLSTLLDTFDSKGRDPTTPTPPPLPEAATSLPYLDHPVLIRVHTIPMVFISYTTVATVPPAEDNFSQSTRPLPLLSFPLPSFPLFIETCPMPRSHSAIPNS